MNKVCPLFLFVLIFCAEGFVKVCMEHAYSHICTWIESIEECLKIRRPLCAMSVKTSYLFRPHI